MSRAKRRPHRVSRRARYRYCFRPDCSPVPQIDADAEIDTPLGTYVGVARGRFALHLDGVKGHIGQARKLAEQAVVCRVDDAAAVVPDLGIRNLSPRRLQDSERAFR